MRVDADGAGSRRRRPAGARPPRNQVAAPTGTPPPDDLDPPPGGDGPEDPPPSPEDPDHPVRRRILEILTDEPGLHKAGLRRRLDVAPEVAEHHLATLEENDRILVEDGEGTNQTVCFTHDQAHLWADEQLRGLWGRHRTRQVAAILVDHAPATSNELARALGLTRTGVRHHLRKLTRRDLVAKERDGLQVHYAPSRELEVWVAEHRDTIQEYPRPDEDRPGP